MAAARTLAALASLCLLAQAPALSQSITPTAAPVPLASLRYSMKDTIRAVRHLFGQRVKGGAGYVAGGSSLLAEAAVETALRPKETPPEYRIETNQKWLGGSLMVSYGLFRFKRFGPRECEQIIMAYVQGEPLPGYVRRRLRPKHFSYRPYYLKKS